MQGASKTIWLLSIADYLYKTSFTSSNQLLKRFVQKAAHTIELLKFQKEKKMFKSTSLFIAGILLQLLHSSHGQTVDDSKPASYITELVELD